MIGIGVSKFCTRIAVPLVLGCVVAALACASSHVTEPASAYGGTYTISWSRSLRACTPQPLPAPLSADSSRYEQLPQSGVLHVDLAVTQNDSAVSLVTASGNENNGSLSDLDLTGVVRRESTLVAQSMSRTEGPRAGGHTFTVSDVRTDSGMFFISVEAPGSDEPDQSQLWLLGSETLAFRDGGSEGPTFTTCTIADSAAGYRIQQN